MPSVQYKVYTRYFNEKRNECISNATNAKWISRKSPTWAPFNNDKFESGQYDKSSIKDEIFEFFTFPQDLADYGTVITITDAQRKAIQDEQIRRIQNIILYSNSSDNEKNDMFFYYCGANFTFADPEKRLPSILCDTFERASGSPWFEYSTQASLDGALTVARKLINKIGKQNVRIGKTVPLEQYIEIV